MSAHKKREKASGQALVEMVIILPVLVLFMSVVVPLVVQGIASSWLDERLSLRHLGQDDARVHQLLERTHETDRLPPYFEKRGLEESAQRSPLGVSIPFPGNFFPGEIYRVRATVNLTESEWWNPSILGDPPMDHHRLSRTLSMVQASSFHESSIPREVRRLTLLGLAPGKVKVLNGAGSKLFHLNLDALPETDARGEDR